MALDVLTEWARQKRHAHDLLDDAARHHAMSGPDAALMHSIVLGVLRNLSLLDHWISALSDDRHLDHTTRWLLRIGLVQCMILDIAPHAAVNETVALAGCATSLVNAILRRALREKDALVSAAEKLPLHLRFSHPQWLTRRWITAFGESATEKLCAWNQQPAPIFIRVNRIRESGASFQLADFIRCETIPRDDLAAGLFYAQDPSTSLSPTLLDSKPGHTVLDACSAPGGKTALMAQLMQNTGRIIACDVSPSRLRRLRENLARLGVTNSETYECDLLSAAPPPWGDIRFDRILLDVPCSNTGVMRRRVDVRWRLQEGDLTTLAQTQCALINRCLPLLATGGALVYSTCSIDADENRAVIDAVLQQHPGLVLTEEKASLPPDSGMDGAYAARLERSPTLRGGSLLP